MYNFVGPKEIQRQVRPDKTGKVISNIEEIQQWIDFEKLKPDRNDEIIVTFIIDLNYHLLVNPRESEHVVCAGGQPVLSAGEMTFELNKGKVISISEITNQSTGYCPSPKSWKEVEKALKLIHIPFPERFTTEYIFRICKKCNCINIVKDNFYVCAFCDSELNTEENEE